MCLSYFCSKLTHEHMNTWMNVSERASHRIIWSEWTHIRVRIENGIVSIFRCNWFGRAVRSTFDLLHQLWSAQWLFIYRTSERATKNDSIDYQWFPGNCGQSIPKIFLIVPFFVMILTPFVPSYGFIVCPWILHTHKHRAGPTIFYSKIEKSEQ